MSSHYVKLNCHRNVLEFNCGLKFQSLTMKVFLILSTQIVNGGHNNPVSNGKYTVHDQMLFMITRSYRQMKQLLKIHTIKDLVLKSLPRPKS